MNSSFCSPILTSSTARAFERFCAFEASTNSLTAGHLVLAIISEESLGCSQLNEFGLEPQSLADGLLGPNIAKLINATQFSALAGQLDARDYPALRLALQQLNHAAWVMPVLDRSISIARRRQESSTSTLDVVLAMAELEGPTRDLLQELGVTPEAIHRQLGLIQDTGDVLPVDAEFQLSCDEDISPAPQRIDFPDPEPTSGRIPALLDANLNRCREGLRVLDDYCRFIIRCEQLTEQIKELRHGLVAAENLLHQTLPDLISYRDVNADAGTQITTASELDRSGLTDLVAANSRRIQESLRSLEEYGKLYSGQFCTAIKAIRYESYSLHQKICQQQTATSSSERSNFDRTERLRLASLYVLLTESLCRQPWKQVVEACLAGGADIIQLREKSLPPSEVVSRGKWISAACQHAGALFIMNDRPDLAVLADADGVHVGQDDLPPNAVRMIIGPSRLIGRSTHSKHQIADANSCRDVDYLGVGPVFPSRTKSFDEFPGLQLVSSADQVATKPWYSIGGIHEANIDQLIENGACRAAVCGSVIASKDPQHATRALRTTLTSSPMTTDTEVKQR